MKGNIAMFDRYSEIQARRAAKDSQESGFTLIELLIVIVVLGILAAIVIFSLTGVTASSAVSACNADAKTVEIAVQAYNSQKGAFPAAATDNASATTAGIVPTYLHTWPSNSPHYAITVDNAGVVSVAAPASGTAIPYDSQTSSTGCNAAK
jgi:prepilin-type N-terminal cleavage/methylation domain-containing protein